VKEYRELQKFGSYTSGLIRKSRKMTTSSGIAARDVFVSCTAAAGDVTGTLSDTPVDGEFHIFVNKAASADDFIIDGGAKNIDGAGTLTITPGNSAILIYFPDDGEWAVV